jgi:peptide/nickel transport system permease protein
MAVIFLVLLIFGALVGPSLLKWDPNQVRLRDAFQAPQFSLNPRAVHVLGTDELGRDVFTRVLIGGRVSLLIGVVGASGTAVVGCAIGLVAGWYRGVVGASLMRFADLQIAFPFLIFAITIEAVLGHGLGVMLLLFTIWSWGGYARVAEGMTLSLTQREFIEASRSVGAGTLRILFRHLLPQLTSPVLVLWSFSFAGLVIAEASLSFLGLGISPPTASWGSMLSEGRQFLQTAWWLVAFPGLAISMTVWGMNTLGDRLRDVLDRRITL